MDQTVPGPAFDRGPWSTGQAILVALAPLAIGVGLAIATNGRETLGPFTSAQLTYWVILPLGALYPTIAAVARRMAYAPTTVLVLAAIAPAMVYATRLAVEARAAAGTGTHANVTVEAVLQKALPPAILAVGAFVAIEIATAAIRRGVAVGVFGAIIAGAVFAASFLVPLFLFPGLLTNGAGCCPT
jgi:hypothetical protein